MWSTTQLGNLISLEYGRALRSSDRDTTGTYPVAGSNGPHGVHALALVEGPGIVVGRKGSAGKVVWYEDDFWPIDTTYFVKRKTDLVGLRWLFYLLADLNLERFATSTGVPGLNRNDVLYLQVSVPPPSEQRRMVEILDQADELRKLRAEADEKAGRILPALFLKMFGDGSSYKAKTLERLLRAKPGALQSGPFGSQLHNSDFVEDGDCLVVGVDNVLDGEFSNGRNRHITSAKHEELKKFTLESGDVLITVMGTVGRSCVFPGHTKPAICTKHVYRIQVNQEILPEYLSSAFRFSTSVRTQLGAHTTGQIVAGINSTSLRQLLVPIPPVERQEEFIRRRTDYESIRTSRRDSARILENLFGILLRRAFAGNLTAKWREAHMNELLEEMEQQGQLIRRPAD